MSVRPKLHLSTEWVTRAPEGSTRAMARGYGLARIGYPLGLFSHACYLVLFWHLGQTEMAIFNIASVLLIGWGLVAAWTLRDIKWPTLLTFVAEIPLHAALCTYFMGLAPFFLGYILFPVLLFPLLPYYQPRTRLFWSLGIGATFVAIGAWAIAYGPARPLPDGWTLFFFLFNAGPIVPFLGIFTAIYATAAETAEDRLEHEFERAEGLLLNILPQPIAERLKEDPHLIADEYPSVSVLFADIVNFTETAGRLTPPELVRTLNTAFSRFDALVEKHGCEKIKTIGDAYMVVSGLPEPRRDHAEAMVALALDMIDAAKDINDSGAFPFSMRIGISSGPVVAGVIGERKFAYDLWGDTVNVASRMESHGQPGIIQITEATRACLGKDLKINPLGNVEVKGKGSMPTYSVSRRN
ncbi:adenylate/guanylate cyclase domain-containing protein [Leisingera sp. McT4-56]|uniref:adenylate/guanylate cyclase domain-containing protein n=1 Tax=Leisingera sp. McT4-56 TaxID=2881255 RepID=UPI001CF906FA|nr:adenylate/guanylate cyclase domain-containing protein [Leisingera sp. McT4-56]MCB4458291.1 adenylate/guanylate cyclase domain-containing protein [Leisingera sp. McT4-56]